jgi:glycosyltransferase involved in cell wall biosynthesis
MRHTLLIHQAFVSPSEAGGTRHFELARHAVAQGDAFTIVASTHNYLTGRQTAAAAPNGGASANRDEVYDGVRVVRVYTYPSLHQSFVWRIVSFVSFMLSSIVAALRVKDVDVVMGTTPPIFQAVSAYLVSALRRKPLLLEVRDLWPEFAIGMGVLRNPLLIRVSRWLEHFLYSRATRLLVNSPAYVTYLQEHGVPASKISFVPNGVDPKMFDPLATGTAEREALGLDGAFVVTYAGALGQANDIPTLLDAARLIRDRTDIRILLVGDGKERTKLEAAARADSLSNVQFLGARPKREMPGLLAASDACLAILQDIPEFRTTYPNKVFDYMAAGRPTILAIDGVIRDVVEAAHGGIVVKPGDARGLADAMLTLAADREGSRLMGQRARAHVVAHFDRAAQAQTFVELLTSIPR